MWTAILLCLLSIALHFYRIRTIPPGLSIDEAAVLYNAYCIAETGADEHGKILPLYFESFGDYKNPLKIYLTVPVLKIMGFCSEAPRIISSLFHLLASFAFYFLLRSQSRNKWICLSGAFIFSVLPWVLPLSRVGLGFTIMLFMYIAGWYCLNMMFRGNKNTFAILSGFFIGMAFYSSHVGRMASPMFILLLFISYNRLLIKRYRQIIAFLAAYSMVLLPFLVSFLANTEMMNRFYHVNLFSAPNSSQFSILEMPSRYLSYFGYDFLFFTGDGTLRHNIGTGELFLFLIPLILFGIYQVLRTAMKNPNARFLAISFLFYPIAAIITTGEINCTRTMQGSVIWMLISMLGLAYLWSHKKKYEILIAIVLIFGTIEIPYYFYNYFYIYPERPETRFAFFAPFTDAFKEAFSSLGTNETLYISKTVSPLPINIRNFNEKFHDDFYIYLLVYGKLAPSAYQENGISGDNFSIYEGRIKKSGMLITSDSFLIFKPGGQYELCKNIEPIPDGALLLKEIQVNPYKKLLVYKLKQP
ncbi:MAG TPA: hypothetical protein DET40_19475 [Lentisphaeria bacterium]|nr:MAG: hypothetical protein A2X45_18305 [Lentisphaerae bacterium GWF2_50_93]HCE45729.1 hypothetical protein [Lentisphaeria bacterium]